MIEFLNIDSTAYMKGLPDLAFDFALVDPDYGIGENWRKDKYSKFYKHRSTYKNKAIPSKEYFDQLFRVSKHQIIWGANYYTEFLPPRNSWIIWDKKRNYTDSHMAECELAWHSLNVPARIIRLAWNGFIRCEPRSGIHPHEKPVGLYKWILNNYCMGEGRRILDTHLGSASSAIAAYQMGFDFVGCEIDPEYYQLAQSRFINETKQLTLFKK